jgi:hydroxyacylglutathione hydrolase
MSPIEVFPVGPLQCNCSLISDPSSEEAVVIDPGGDPEHLLAAIAKSRVRVVALLHTHAHFDHLGGTRALREATLASVRLHPADLPLWQRAGAQAAIFGLRLDDPPAVDAPLADGETMAIGSRRLRVLHTPGHTPGSSSFLLEGEPPVLFAGDTLFRRSIGRTDLWGGSAELIASSIRKRLFLLPEDTAVVPGHGPATTIGEEKALNPFVGENAGDLR